ncbi:MAG: sigma-70 family RNA polymerase sigma factor [Candidatus Hydrogenedentes bacterium]|nr:sigma-70 family RNA polymerase sigma factor [Candidatus Hydrogenedentota bacterium]
MNEPSQWDLVARARTGDAEAFAQLVRRYEQGVVAFCQRMVHSRDDAEDLAQESFIRVYRYLGRLRPEAKFSTALFGIARNLTLNFLRDSRRRGRGKTQSLTREDASQAPLHDETNNPGRQARLREIERLIERALERVSPEHREMLILRELNGLDYDAIAAVTKCPKGTVKSRLARAREQLRLQLLELGGDEV